MSLEQSGFNEARMGSYIGLMLQKALSAAILVHRWWRDSSFGQGKGSVGAVY